MQKQESGVSFNEVCYYASIPLSAAQILGGAVLVGSGPLGWGTAAGMFIGGCGVGGAYYTYNTEKSDFEFTKYCKKSLVSGLASGVGGVVMTMGGPGSLVGIAGIARSAVGGALGGAVGGVANSVLEGRGLPSGIQIGKYMAVGAFAGGIGQLFNYGVLEIGGRFYDTARLNSVVLNRLFFTGLNAIAGGIAAGGIKLAANSINRVPLAEGVMGSAQLGAAIAGAISCAQIDYSGNQILTLDLKGHHNTIDPLIALLRPQVLSQVAQAESAQFKYEQDAYDKANAEYQEGYKVCIDFLSRHDEAFGYKSQDEKNVINNLTKEEAATAMMQGKKIGVREKGDNKNYNAFYTNPDRLKKLQQAQANLEDAKLRVGIKIEEQLLSLYTEEQTAYEKANAEYQRGFKKCSDILSGCDEVFGYKLEGEKDVIHHLTKEEAATAMMHGKKICGRKKGGKYRSHLYLSSSTRFRRFNASESQFDSGHATSWDCNGGATSSFSISERTSCLRGSEFRVSTRF